MSSNQSSSMQTFRSDVSTAPTSEYIFVDPRSIERHMRKEARKLFVLERADILLQLPSPYKQSFNRVMFWMKKYPTPILILSCYDVPPGPLRARWMARFLQEREKNNGMINMPLLAYQYGVSLGSLGTACPREDAYTFLEPSQDQLIPFEEGVKYAFDQIPREIQKKILLKLPLDAVDKQALDSRKEMQEAFNTKSERRGGYPSFEEGYNLLYCKLSDNDQQPSPPAAASSLQNSHALANTALSESQASPSRDNLAKIKVGSRIEVFWPEDDEYYPARVDEVRRPFYHINYDDGEEEWLPLDEHEYLLHEDGSESQREIDSVKNEGIRFLKSDYEDAGLQNSEDEGKHVESLSRAITKNTSKIPRRSEPFLTGLANDEQSGYLKKSGDRFTVDGCIIPKQTLRQLNDGTYAAPKGRHPIGTYFDAMRGLFVPYKTRSDAAETDHPLSENDVSHEGQQPIKKRKVLD